MSYLKKKVNNFRFREDIMLFIIVSTSFMIGRFFYLKNLYLSIITGLFMGVFAAVIICYRDKYKKRGDNYQKGIDGEEYIEKILNKKRELMNLYFIRNVKLEYGGDADFLIINENGVFCLEVKNISGTITYNKNNNCLSSNNKYEKNYLRRVKGNSRQINKLILEKAGKNIYINPILIFSGFNSNIETEKEVDSVYIIKPDNIKNDLYELLNAERVSKIDNEMQKKIYTAIMDYKKLNNKF